MIDAVEFDERIEPIELAIEMKVGVEVFEASAAGSGGEVVAASREQVDIPPGFADGGVGGEAGGAVALKNGLRAARRGPVQAGRKEELLLRIGDQGVLHEAAEVEPAFAIAVKFAPVAQPAETIAERACALVQVDRGVAALRHTDGQTV